MSYLVRDFESIPNQDTTEDRNIAIGGLVLKLGNQASQ